MADLSLIRHQEIFNPSNYNIPVTIIGAGATGSRLFMSLIELGMTEIVVYDFDKVEPHNLANQAFTHAHLEMPKVKALGELYAEKTGRSCPDTIELKQHRLPKEGHADVKGIVFLLTDTMASRKEIYEACIKNNPNVYHVIETRMASSYGNVFSFNPMNVLEAAAWVETLSDDEETEVSACGSSISVGPTASIIANLAVWQMINTLHDDASADAITNIFLKPLTLSTASL